MATEENTAPVAPVTEQKVDAKAEPKKAAAKAEKKPAAKKKTASAKVARKVVAKKPVTKKAVAKKAVAKKVTARKPAAKKTTKKADNKATPEFAARAQEAGRNAFLASLGFYGKAFDQVQEQFNGLQSQLEERRAKANDLYAELVKRGEKVESDARDAIDDLDMPEFKIESLTNREKLDARLDKAKARFNELKDSVSFKSAA